MPVTPNQPVAFIAPTDSSIETSDNVIRAGQSPGPPEVFISQQDPIAIEVTMWVA